MFRIVHNASLWHLGCQYLEREVEEAVRELCREVSNEKDTGRALELLRQLREILTLQQEEARLRISVIAKHYHISDAIRWAEAVMRDIDRSYPMQS
jgi:DNA replicative helicase MCM subunit Mcm2 (Cdc46/Mcm family)